MLQSMRVAAKWIWWAIAILFLVGFVFYEQSGLSGEKVTAGSTVAKVNGTPIAYACLLYTSPSPRDRSLSRMPSSA